MHHKGFAPNRLTKILGHPRGTPPGREAVVVLGYRNEGERINAVNRFRVRAALRTLDPAAGESVLVCCGGAVGGPVPDRRRR